MALSARLAEKNMVILDSFQLAEIKTKGFVEVMTKLGLDNALIVIDSHDEKLEKSARNVMGYKVIVSAGLNVYDVLLHKNIILVQPAIEKLEERLLP